VVTFTHNEVLYGVIARSRRAREFVRRAADSDQWIFGVHVQGDCTHLSRWPLEPWQAFVMWPDATVPFLADVPVDQLVDLNCVNFLPQTVGPFPKTGRRWDICVVSRASQIKRIAETLELIKLVLDRYPTLRVNFVVPDPRRLRHGDRTYAIDDIERHYFELPKRLFSTSQLRQMSFLSASVESFGQFPIAHDVIQSLLAQSKFLLLSSRAEGTPRVIGEALLVGTPCMVSARLRSGMTPYLTRQPTVVLDDDDPVRAAGQVISALQRYEQFDVDVAGARDAFAEGMNRPRLVARLSEILRRRGHAVEGDWVLDDLHLRLCGHGRKRDLQFLNNPDLLFRWFAHVDSVDPYDEDNICGRGGAVDRRRFDAGRRFAGRVSRRVHSATGTLIRMARAVARSKARLDSEL
jgi:hypothetical protein